jgi:hypothetical protein
MASRAWGQTLDDDPARLVRRTTATTATADGDWPLAHRPAPARGRSMHWLHGLPGADGIYYERIGGWPKLIGPVGRETLGPFQH